MSRHASLLAIVLLVASCAPRANLDLGPTDDVPPALDVASDRAVDTRMDVAPPPDSPSIDRPSIDRPSTDTPSPGDTPSPADTSTCPGGDTRCGAECVDTRTSSAHCGECGRACAASQSCAAGVCTALPSDCRTTPCPMGTYCNLGDGVCRPGCLADAECPQPGTCDPATHACRCAAATHRCGTVCLSDASPASCGAACSPCASQPNATATCAAGACGFTCNAGFHRCGDACVSDASVEACGAACTRCPAAPANGTVACTGTCVARCNPDYHLCGAACVSDASPATCGSACSPCAAPPNGVATCASGACGFTCNTGYHRCGAACVADDSTATCGASCVACPAAPANARATCTGGACGYDCNAGYSLCRGDCIDTTRDVANCGGCGRRCQGGATCNGGSCTCATASQTYCGSGCVDLQSNNANCGMCGVTCYSPTSCSAGRCTCPGATQTLCGLSCVDLQSSRENCGACGTVCPIGCSNGRCATVAELMVTPTATTVRMGDGAYHQWTGESGLARVALPTGTTRYFPAADTSCALVGTGAVWCAGSNYFGQLGSGSSAMSRATFEPTSGLADAADVWGAGLSFCARRSDDRVSCWGLNDSRQLGFSSPSSCTSFSIARCVASPVESPPFLNARQIEFGRYRTCILTAAGAVLCTGPIGAGVLETLIPSGASFVGVGEEHQCALMTNGTVQCWGSNRAGGLGDGTTTDRTTPVAVLGITTATQLGVGRSHNCALLADRTVRCWGGGYYGQLGNGNWSSQSTPVAVYELTGVDLLSRSVTADHTCARRTDGTVWCWGVNSNYQLGDGTREPRSRPVAMRL